MRHCVKITKQNLRSAYIVNADNEDFNVFCFGAVRFDYCLVRKLIRLRISQENDQLRNIRSRFVQYLIS